VQGFASARSGSLRRHDAPHRTRTQTDLTGIASEEEGARTDAQIDA
jgi:hypothetical protein